MNTDLQKLLDRLKKTFPDISQTPKTATQMALLLEDLVISFEQIAADLRKISDEEIAATLKAMIDRSSEDLSAHS